MTRAVIGGLITSTLLAFVVVPVACTYLDDIAPWAKSRFLLPGRRRRIREEQERSGLVPEPVGDS